MKINSIAKLIGSLVALLLPSLGVPCQLEPTEISKYLDDSVLLENKDHSIQLIVRGVTYYEGQDEGREGPVDVVDLRTGQKICTADIELLHPPFAFAGSHYFYFTSADAMDAWQGVLDLNTCQLAWRSPSQVLASTHYPKLTKNAVILNKKTYKIKDNCLPTLKSTPLELLPKNLD
jgi:hypothetical protein